MQITFITPEKLLAMTVKSEAIVVIPVTGTDRPEQEAADSKTDRSDGGNWIFKLGGFSHRLISVNKPKTKIYLDIF